MPRPRMGKIPIHLEFHFNPFGKNVKTPSICSFYCWQRALKSIRVIENIELFMWNQGEVGIFRIFWFFFCLWYFFFIVIGIPSWIEKMKTNKFKQIIAHLWELRKKESILKVTPRYQITNDVFQMKRANKYDFSSMIFHHIPLCEPRNWLTDECSENVVFFLKISFNHMST